MAIEISRREVMNNLIRFKDTLLELHEKKKSKDSKKERVYRVLLNRRTGDMRFAQKISSLEHHFHKKGKGSAEDWKEVRLIVIEREGHQVHFEVRDSANHELTATDLEPLAWRISSETLNVLNIKGKEVHEVSLDKLPEEIALADLSSIHLASQGERIDDLPGWAGPLSRLEAEKKLMDKPQGTFLIREADVISHRVAEQLSLSNHLSVHPYVLTVVEKGLKISEYLILHTDKGWMVYADEPRLELSAFYPSPPALLHALKSIARHAI
jgi:hypothetical protein